jgi:RHS repeat-associated protein
MDRLTSVAHPDGTSEVFTYDKLDCVMEQDRLGHQSVFTYDSLRQMVAALDPLDHVTRFQYCGCGSLASMIDPLGQQTSWIHDIQGRITGLVRADGSRVSFNYENTTSRLKSIVDEKGQYKIYSYYLDDLLQSISYPVAASPTPAVNFAYDPIYPRVVSMQDGIGTATYTYNPVTVPPSLGAGKLASTTGPLPNSLVTLQYDQLGREVGRAINGVARLVTLDALGRPTVETNALGTFQYSYYGATPQLASEVYPNGQSNSYSYYGATGDERLLQVQHFKPGGALLSALGFSYNALGEITALSNQWDTLPTQVWLPTYDAAFELTGVSSTGGPLTVSNYTYAYDAAGNRTLAAVNGVSNSYYYNSLNQLQSGGTGSTNANYAWDGENRLATITAGTTTSDFSYDGYGRRCQIVEKTNGITVSNNYFLWCADEICEVRDSTGASVVKRLFPQGELVVGGSGGTNYYYTRDHLGSVQEALNGSGSLATRYVYDPFGQKSVLEEGYQTTFGFAGDFVHARSGLDLTWFRAYDSAKGRWLSRDPVASPRFLFSSSLGPTGLGQYLPPGFFGAARIQQIINGPNINLYQYALNNPLIEIDPLGTSTVQIGISINGELGPISINWNFGVASDNHGGFGLFNSVGASGGVGAGLSGGLSVAVSDAQGICDLAGPFWNSSVTGNVGLGGSIDTFGGPSDHGTVTGAGFTLGVGAGGGVSAGGSTTIILPLR